MVTQAGGTKQLILVLLETQECLACLEFLADSWVPDWEREGVWGKRVFV